MGIAVSPQIHPQVAEFIDKPRKMLINGRWVNAASGKTFPTYNPATGEVLAQVAEGDREDIDQAVKAARNAFDNGPWRRMTASERGRLIWKLADLLEQHTEEFGYIESLDNGKPLNIAKAADVPLAVDLFRYMAGWATKIEGNTIPLSVPYTPGAKYLAYTLREPVGVVGTNHSLELPAADGRVETWSRAGHGLHGRVEARRANPALRAASRRSDHGSRLPRRRGQRCPRLWRNGGGRAGRSSRRRQGRLHRIDRSRQADRPRGRRQPQESVAGVGRQVSERRVSKTPISRPRSLAPPAPSSSTTASAAARVHGCTSRNRSTTRSSKESRSMPEKSKSDRVSIPKRRWARWSQKSN